MVHFPAVSNLIVFPDNGRSTGGFVSLDTIGFSLAVRRSLPSPELAGLKRLAITDAGATSL